MDYMCLIGRQPGMSVHMPTPINQLFNDESIAVKMIFLDVYIIREISHRFNGTQD